MDPIEIEAMLVRKEAVFSSRQALGYDAMEMLEAILFPHEDVLNASINKAKQTGPSPLALKLSRMGKKRARRLSKAAQEHKKSKESENLDLENPNDQL